MRHLNKTKQLGKTNSHRNAMFSNMVTSFIIHERIVTTKQKAKELKIISEKLITRAKRNLTAEIKPESVLHNKREVMRFVKNRDAVAKLFTDIAVRNKDRNGGYTRIYLLDRRPGDAAEKVMIEFVEAKTETAQTSEKK